jgi:hypothetical protein
LDEIRKDEQSNETKRMMSRQLSVGVGYSIMDGRDAALAEKEELAEFEERIKTFRKRQTIDMDDSVTLICRLFSHVAACPGTLSTEAVAAHVVSKDLLDILCVQLVCLFVSCPDRPGHMMKFTSRSTKPEVRFCPIAYPSVRPSRRHLTTNDDSTAAVFPRRSSTWRRPSAWCERW